MGKENGGPMWTDFLSTSHSSESEIPPNWTLQQKITGLRELVISSKLGKISNLLLLKFPIYYYSELDRTVILSNDAGQWRRANDVRLQTDV